MHIIAARPDLKSVALPVNKVGPYSLIQCMKILPDNRVLVAGNCITPGSATSVDIFMALYNPNGSLDATFGNGGVKVLDFNNAWDDVYKIAYRDNNNIYMFGTSGTNRIAYKTDITGKIDNTFGNNGLVTFPYTSFNGNAWYIGTVSPSNYLYTSPDTGSAQQQNYFSYKGTGSANTSFGNMGYYTAGTRDRVSNMLAQPDNKILVLGTNGLRPRLLRFLGSGTTSVPDISPEAGINAWAANGHCFISFSQKVPSFSATLLNVEGKVMGRWSEQNTDITGDQIKVLKLPADMPQGIYLMRIDSQVGTKTIRLSL